MAGVESIESRESLAAWLKPRPQADAIAVTHRAALRLLPLYSSALDGDWARRFDLTALPVLRCHLATGVMRKYPTQEVSDAAGDACGHADAVGHDAGADALIVAAAWAASAAADAVFGITAEGAFAIVADATVLWDQIRNDARALEAGADPLPSPLWQGAAPDWFREADAKARALWQAGNPAHWSFWLRWWEGVLEGQPLNWELQRDIALISGDDWNKGAAHVAGLIVEIEERHRLLQQIADLKNALRASELRPLVNLATPEHRAHNQPPELLETPLEVRREVTIIWAAVDEAEAELKKPNPTPSVVARVGRILLDATGRLMAYCLGLGDVAAKKAAEELGSSGTKWAIRLCVGGIISQIDAVQSLGRGLLEFAQKLGLGG